MSGPGRHIAPRPVVWPWIFAVIVAAAMIALLAHAVGREPVISIPVPVATPCPAPVDLVPHVSLHRDFPARNFIWSCFP